MLFEGIWFDMDREIQRDEVEAANAEEASVKLHRKYENGFEPAEALAIVPKEPYPKGNDINGYYTTNGNWGKG